MVQNQTTNTPARRGLSPELARKILSDGKMTSGNGPNAKTAFVFTNTLSDLPPMRNDELVGHDFWIIRLSGEVTTDYGLAWIFEIGNKSDLATNSWLVGQPVEGKSGNIIGKNLKGHFARNGANALPLWIHLAEHDGSNGTYYALEAPHILVNAADNEPAPPPPPPTNDLEDLPF